MFHWIHYSFCDEFKMRSYGKNFLYKKATSYKERQTRLATEWDVRVDVSSNFTAEQCIAQIREHLDEYLFVLVSGVERPDITEHPANQHGSKEHHLHVSIVLLAPLCRMDVLRLVRGPRKRGDEYAAPRNPKFTYAGWVIHHGKPGFKIDGEPLVRFEYGTLPMDALTTDNAMKIKAMLKKWGTDGMAKRFKMYTDLLERDIIKAKIERLQMSLEDNA